MPPLFEGKIRIRGCIELAYSVPAAGSYQQLRPSAPGIRALVTLFLGISVVIPPTQSAAVVGGAPGLEVSTVASSANRRAAFLDGR